MLALGIGLYLALSIVVGVLAARRRVRTTQDFLLAGRRLSFPLATATVFATWFGAETLLGASSSMAEEGLLGTIEEPFGAALCLVLVGALFAGPIYRRNLLTIGDLFREAYGPVVERVASTVMALSYLAWIGGQFVALAVVLQVVLGLNFGLCLGLGMLVVVAYTAWGGMWSVAVMDLVQNLVIIVGLGALVLYLLPGVDAEAWSHRLPERFFTFFPHGARGWFNWLAAWFTIGLGSLPGQDVYQRVMASRSERIARRSSLLAGGLYLVVGAAPLFLAAYIRAQHPQLLQPDAQQAIPQFVLQHTPPWLALLFFGALLSAILSTASGALLASAALFTENVLPRRLAPPSPRAHLRWVRGTVVVLGVASVLLALASPRVHELAMQSSAVTLVSLVGLLAAALWLRPLPGPRAALLCMAVGTATWLLALGLNSAWAPTLLGFLASGLCLAVVWGLQRTTLPPALPAQE